MKVKFSCVVWHGIVTVLKTDRQRYEACSSDWYNMKLLYVPVAICVCLFICRLWGSVHWDPLEMLLKLRNIKLQMLKVWGCISVNENTKGCWKNASSQWATDMLDKVTRWSSWQYYCQMWGVCAFFAFTTIIKQQVDKAHTGQSVFSLAIMSEYSYATWTNEMHTFQINTLVHFFNFWLLYVPNLMGSLSGWFETCKRWRKFN